MSFVVLPCLALLDQGGTNKKLQNAHSEMTLKKKSAGFGTEERASCVRVERNRNILVLNTLEWRG